MAGSLWDFAVERLVPYLVEMGFTHVELLPITEHPFGGSWGYQPLSSVCAERRAIGPPQDLSRFVDALHAAGIGIILDWVPAHFPTDPHGLARFDGTALYEHLDPREGFHHDWNTFIYNFGRREVQGFLIASALYWLEHFHVDGLRVDAVASMLYRDYSRREGEWIPNVYGGRENLEAIGFLRHLNAVVAERCPGRDDDRRGIDGLARRQPADFERRPRLFLQMEHGMDARHARLHGERADPSPVSSRRHDLRPALCVFREFHSAAVARRGGHGKGSLIGKMPGDRWQRFANLRAYFGFMWGHPGKKLLFMGGEFAQEREWNHDRELDWPLDRRSRACRRSAPGARSQPSLRVRARAASARLRGERLSVDGRRRSLQFGVCVSASRGRCNAPVLVVCNMTPVPRHGYRIGVPRGGGWREIFNSDSGFYGGSNVGNDGRVDTAASRRARPASSLELVLPPLATIFLRHDGMSRWRLCRPNSIAARPIRSAPPGTAWAPISRCSPPMPSASSFACSIRPAAARSRASICRNAPTRSGTAICPNARTGLIYGYRAYGPYSPQDGHRFNPHKLLLDPYARQFAGTLRWSDALFGYRINSPRADLSFDRRDSAPGMLKAVVSDDVFDWGDDRPPNVPWSETVIYEAHVRGMTMLRHDIRANERGTFAGAGGPERHPISARRSASPRSSCCRSTPSCRTARWSSAD